jgi:pyridinium-3,5-biscarboxylic acid mononucleotide sulfurtransferase
MSELSERFIAVIREIGPMIVAFSGGVDSAVVAAGAIRALPAHDVLAVTADSESLAVGELETCERLATEWGVPWRATATDEMSDPRYIANSGDRCYWCKSALMDQLQPIASQRHATVVLGVNLDDLGDHRPGQQAAAERGARFPLVEAGISKAEVREIAKEWGLEVWDRPSMPCLSSRIPYGTPVSITLLSRIDRAEKAVRELGFGDVRVRDYGDTARIEVLQGDLLRAAQLAAQLHDRVTSCGYLYVTLDLGGLRSGNLNAALSKAAASHG